MELSCLQENLFQGLNIVSKITSSRAELPILKNIWLQAEKGFLKLSTTNLEIAITTKSRAKVTKTGAITIPAQLLTNYIGFLPNEVLDLKVINNELIIKSKNQKAKIKGIPADEFPIIPRMEKKEGYLIEAKYLKEALEKTLFTISSAETRVEISGAYFIFNYPDPGILTIVGTDSYRLARKQIPLKKTVSEKKEGTIIPLKTLKEVLRVIADEKDVELYSSENQVLFVYKDTELISRIISGEYPAYEQIIPTRARARAILDKENFLKVIKAASFFTQTNINDIKLKFLPRKNKLFVTSANDRIGEHEARIETEISGEDSEIIFNYRYLVDGLANLTSGEISLEIVDSNTPALIKSKDDTSYLYLIMPIQPR